MQLLKITTVPIKYKVEQENAVPESDSSFNVELEKNTSNVKIPVAGSEKSQRRPDMVRDRSSFRANGINNAVTDSVNDSGQNDGQNDYDVKYCYGRKNVSPESKVQGNAMKMVNYSSVPLDAAIDEIDSLLPDSSWEPDLAEKNGSTDNTVHTVHHKPRERKIVEEFAHVEIEYLGGFNYVPKSSAPDYEEPEEK